jgi:hypothetical protein
VPKLLQNLPLKPFHWQLEFPEVFLRERPGFDAILGNPPFGGKNTILDSNGEPYIKLLQTLNPHAHGNSDLVAYFFLRAASILREGGTFGLVATNTIKQGDTRATGLQHMTAHGITLYDAVLDQPWAGGAAVVVDVVHGCRGPSPTGQTLNSSLENTVEIPDPKPLKENEGKGFIGCYVLGTGFLLTTDQAKAFVLQDPVNEEIIKPYLGGEELNSNIPEDEDGHIQVSRHVINFGDMTEEEAQKWPELFDIIKLKVKPERDLNNREVRKKFWWKFGERAPKLYNKIKNIEKCMVCSSVSKYMLFEFQPTDRVFSHALVVFALDDWFSFAVLQSRVHEVWAREAGLGSTMKTDARYTPSTCFETFPFPRGEAGLVVAAGEAGRVFYEARQAAMIRYQEGMTKLWNRVVDPENDASDIEALRRLKEAMDRAVLAAYGWSDLGPSEGVEIVRRLRLLNVERAR